MSEKKQGRILLFIILILIVFVIVSVWSHAYWNELLTLELKSYSDLGQIATALIATLVALLAGWQVLVQRELAASGSSAASTDSASMSSGT
jgi:polyferredoxin